MRGLLQALVVLLFFSLFMGLHQVENNHSRSLPDEKMQFLSSENTSNQTLDADSDGLNDSVDPCPNSSYNHCIKAAFGDSEHSPNIARGLWCGYPILLIFIWISLSASDPRLDREIKFDDIRKNTGKMKKSLDAGDVERAVTHLSLFGQYQYGNSIKGLKGHHHAGDNKNVFSDYFATACDVLTIAANNKVDEFIGNQSQVQGEINRRGLEDEISLMECYRVKLKEIISMVESDNVFGSPEKNLDEARQSLQRLESTIQLLSPVDTHSSAAYGESEESNIP